MCMRCFGALILAALVMPALAQEIVEINEGQVHALSGKVTDPKGAPMANLTVVRTSVNGKKVLATTHTDSHGHFAFKVPDGRYTLRFVAPGFKTVIIRVTVFHKIHKMLNVEMSVEMSQGSGQTQLGGAPATSKVIKDPAEYNAYMTALNTQEPAARAADMEAFVKQYPQSVVQVDGLEQAMASYQEAGNQAGAEGSAKRILLLASDNIRALAIVTAIDRSRVSGGDQEALKEMRTSARTGLQRLPGWQKPEGVADASFAKLKNQMADANFSGKKLKRRWSLLATCARQDD